MPPVYLIQKNRNTTVQAIQVGGEICNAIITGDGLTDADCPCGKQHAAYTNPVWEVAACLTPDDEDADNYMFGPADMQMVVPKTDCFSTRADALTECESRNA